MFRIIYPEKDSTLYEIAPTLNTGIDEILEVGKRNSSNGYQKSRSVIKFDIDEITATLSKYNVALEDCKFLLQVFTSHAKNLPSEYTIDANIVGEMWTNGTGFENSYPTKTDGATWTWPSTGSNWISGSQNQSIAGTSLYITGSGGGGSWLYQSGSGIFNTSSFNSSWFYQPGLDSNNESFSYRPTDINMDVTDAIQLWISGSNNITIPNHGFLLKFSDADEADTSVGGYVRFFSRETHTIYVPRILMLFDISEYDTALDSIDLDSYSIYLDLKSEYKDTEITKIRINGRDKYPMRSPTNTYPITTIKKLPETTYYSILDAHTDETIIPYDDIYTKVSCDNTSNFIYVDMNSFQPERYYKIEFKIKDGFTEHYIDNKYYFKVVR